jgi:hypothetical protein
MAKFSHDSSQNPSALSSQGPEEGLEKGQNSRLNRLQRSRALRMQRLRRLSFLLDNAIQIPGTSHRIGLDPIIGLIPGGGDTAGLVLSAFIVLEAAQLGASKSTLSTMALNILLETMAGTLPGLGDLFDATWKSNSRNLQLLEQHFELPHPATPARNRWFAILLIFGLGLVFLLCAYASFRLLQAIIQLLLHASK